MNSRTDDGLISEDQIDDALMGSFPASDPPCWTLGLDHQPKNPTDPGDDLNDSQTREEEKAKESSHQP
jgi:hypothetical protein